MADRVVEMLLGRNCPSRRCPVNSFPASAGERCPVCDGPAPIAGLLPAALPIPPAEDEDDPRAGG